MRLAHIFTVIIVYNYSSQFAHTIGIFLYYPVSIDSYFGSQVANMIGILSYEKSSTFLLLE